MSRALLRNVYNYKVLYLARLIPLFCGQQWRHHHPVPSPWTAADLNLTTGYDFATDYNKLFNFYPTILTSK